MAEKKKLGQILLDSGLLDEFQLKSALGYQQKWGGKLGDVLVENHFITEDSLLVAIQQQTGIAVVRLDGRNVPDYLIKLVPLELVEKHELVPIGLEGEADGHSETLVIAMSDPTDLNALDELSFLTGKRVKPVLASSKDIYKIIQSQYRGVSSDSPGGFEVGDAAAGFAGSIMSQTDLDGSSGAEAKGVPSSAGLMMEDPFAELDSFGPPSNTSTSTGSIGQEEEAVPEPLLEGDPFAELDALSFAASSEDEELDIDVALLGDKDEELEELEIIEDIDAIEESPQASVPPREVSVPGLVLEQNIEHDDRFSQGSEEALEPGPAGLSQAGEIFSKAGLAPPDGLEVPLERSGLAGLEPSEPTPIIKAPAPEKTPLDDLPDLDPISDDDALTPPEVALAQTPDLQNDPFSDGTDLDFDGVLSALPSDGRLSSQDTVALTSENTDLQASEENFSQVQPDEVTVRSDSETVRTPELISDQVTTVVKMPVAPDSQDNAIKSSAMNDLLSRVGLKNGQPGRKVASSVNASDTVAMKNRPRTVLQADSATLHALIDVLLSKGLITEEELQKAKERT